MTRHSRRSNLAVLASLLLTGLRSARSALFDDPPKPFDPTDRYEIRQIEGWTVMVNKGFLADQPELANRALELLKFQLYQVVRRLPAPAVEKIRTIKLWLEEKNPETPCMAYHPAAEWLREHGVNPDKARCVEISNARNFLAWSIQQPWMVLHELAHAYHHQYLMDGFQNREIKAAFDQAMKAGQYKQVLKVNGKEEKAYAATNPMEYFAEATEAYFGTNDFYPFVRPELKKYDPDVFTLLGKLWGA